MPPLSDPQGSWRLSSAACSAWASGCFGVKFPPASSACVSFGIRTSDASDTSDTSVNDGGRFWGGELGCSFPEHHIMVTLSHTFTYVHTVFHVSYTKVYKDTLSATRNSGTSPHRWVSTASSPVRWVQSLVSSQKMGIRHDTTSKTGERVGFWMFEQRFNRDWAFLEMGCHLYQESFEACIS